MSLGAFSAIARAGAEDADAWREDLRFLAAELPKRHANLFHTTSREAFEAAVARLDERIPSLNRQQILVEMARIVAMARDGHSGLLLLPIPNAPNLMNAGALPVEMYYFEDGLRIIAASRAHAGLIGRRVVRIGNASTEDAFAAIRQIVPSDNELGATDVATLYVSSPEILFGLGLTEKPNQAVFVVEDEHGQKTSVVLDRLEGDSTALVGMTIDAQPVESADWVRGRDGAATEPLWLKNASTPYWFEYLPESKTVYMQFAMVRDRDDEHFPQFCARMFEFIEKNGAERLVIDLRLNRGGNGAMIQPLIHGIIRSDRVNRPGHLFTITGRRTFSAAQILVAALEEHTQTLFVGEPTGSKPNHYGESTVLQLPRSGALVFFSSLYWQNSDPRDKRLWVPPHVVTPLTFADYVANRDPALSAILSYSPAPPIRDVLLKTIADGGGRDALRKACDAYRAKYANPYRETTETDLNTLGYDLLNAKRFDEAIAILTLGVDEFPKSANAFDSLGEAYMLKGDRERAIENYERSLVLDPNNFNAVRALLALRGDHK